MATGITIVEESGLAGFEKERLAELELVIQGGSDAFMEVGMALVEIRESRLYRGEYRNFEEYCQRKWGFGRNYGNKLIRAAHIAVNLMAPDEQGTTGTLITEREARELSVLDDPAEIRTVYEEASQDGKPTARKIRTIVDMIKNRKIVAPTIPDGLLAIATSAVGQPLVVHTTQGGADVPWGERFCLYAETSAVAKAFNDAIGTAIVTHDLGTGILYAPLCSDDWFFDMLDRCGQFVILRDYRMVAFPLNCSLSDVVSDTDFVLEAA